MDFVRFDFRERGVPSLCHSIRLASILYDQTLQVEHAFHKTIAPYFQYVVNNFSRQGKAFQICYRIIRTFFSRSVQIDCDGNCWTWRLLCMHIDCVCVTEYVLLCPATSPFSHPLPFSVSLLSFSLDWTSFPNKPMDLLELLSILLNDTKHINGEFVYRAGIEHILAY